MTESVKSVELVKSIATSPVSAALADFKTADNSPASTILQPALFELKTEADAPGEGDELTAAAVTGDDDVAMEEEDGDPANVGCEEDLLRNRFSSSFAVNQDGGQVSEERLPVSGGAQVQYQRRKPPTVFFC